jgi:predicted RNA-binding protein with PIN domain
MRYIVDGYNVINASDLFISSTLEGRRDKLFDFIRNNRPHGSVNNSITVVFDCRTKNPYESNGYNTSHLGEIEVIFSDGTIIADDIIAQKCDEAENPSEIIVITNDKGIHRRIALSGAKHESVESFIAKGNKKKNSQRAKKIVSDDIRKEINEELKKLWL